MAVLPQLFPIANTAPSGAPIIWDQEQHSGRRSKKKTNGSCHAFGSKLPRNLCTRPIYADPSVPGRGATRIINEVRGINRVACDVTSKPPGDDRVGVTGILRRTSLEVVASSPNFFTSVSQCRSRA